MASARSEPSRDPRIRVQAWAGALLLRALRRSLRMRFHDDCQIRAWEREERRFIFTSWHRHLLLLRYAYRGSRMSALASRSRDGELIAQVLERLGVGTSRGSSSRGGSAALRELVRAARNGSDLGVTPDGPRGPLRQVQPGVIKAAALTGLPILPVAQAATRRKFLSSWDRMPIPIPGSTVHWVYGPALEVPRDAAVEEWAPRVQAALNAVEAKAERLAGHGDE